MKLKAKVCESNPLQKIYVWKSRIWFQFMMIFILRSVSFKKKK